MCRESVGVECGWWLYPGNEEEEERKVPDCRSVVCVALLTCRHVSPNEDDVEESHGPSGEDDAQA